MAAAPDLPLPPASGRSWFLCAWCRSPLSERVARPPRSVDNFGICPACLESELERERRRAD